VATGGRTTAGRRPKMSKVISGTTATSATNERSTTMKNAKTSSTTVSNAMTEMVDSWIKGQQEFLDNLVKAQKDGMDRVVEATVKAEESLKGFSVPQEGPAKQVQGFYASMMTTVFGSVKAIAADAVKVQEAWKGSVEKQMELTGNLAKQCAGVFQAAAAQK
jgi:hypothetical protein